MAKISDSIDKIAQNADERLFLTRIAEKAETCRTRSYPTSTRFLDLHEGALARRLLEALGNPRHMFWGGYDRAERQVLLFLPDWMEEAAIWQGDDCPLALVRCMRSKRDALTHRDYLGSLMGLGLRRDCIGDILVGEHGADIIVLGEIVPFLLMNYEKAGRKHLSVSELPLTSLLVPEEKVHFVRDTVASMRVDAIVSSMFRMPRTKAADAVRAGRVYVNQQQCLHADKEVGVHDRITLRGKGRGEVDDVLGESRKGRIVVSLKRFDG